MKDCTKKELSEKLCIPLSTLYYRSKKEEKDWELKQDVEKTLHEHPSYGHRRIALHLKINKKKVRRVMRLYGIKPYRRRARKARKTKTKVSIYPNLLLTERPLYRGHIWAADFTEVVHKGGKLYVATVLDCFTREIVGVALSLRKGTQLTLQALYNALLYNRPPGIFHSDNGSEYKARVFVETLTSLSILISRIHPGCPWENGYQESFYDKLKVDLGDPNRFSSLGELVAVLYETVYTYNNDRIHSALKMPPAVFAKRLHERSAAE